MHAYLIIAHNQFDLLIKLIRVLDDKRNDIYVHIDKKVKTNIKNKLEEQVKYSRIYFVNRINVVWGDYSQIKCELILFKEAINNRNYEYLHLLSGVDFPIKTQDYIHEFFENNLGKEFVHIEKNKISEEEVEKIQCYFPFQKFVGKKNSYNSILYIIQRIIVNFQKRLKFNRHEKKHINFYKGANWVSITGDFAKYLIKKEEWIKKIFKNSKCGDEIFLQTILMNSKFKNNLYNKQFSDNYKSCLRYIDWKRGNPYIFRYSDLKELQSVEYIFARKFDMEIDSKIVDELYKSLLGDIQ